MPVLRFLRELTRPFFQWWWATLTGVASILSWLGVPEGHTFSRAGVTALVFLGLTMAFLTSSVLVQGFRWFSASGIHPTVTGVFKSTESPPCTFVIASNGALLKAGSLLCAYRDVDGIEVVVAVLRVVDERHDGGGHQCVPVWYSDGHLNEIMRHRGLIGSLLLRADMSDATRQRMLATERERT